VNSVCTAKDNPESGSCRPVLIAMNRSSGLANVSCMLNLSLGHSSPEILGSVKLKTFLFEHAFAGQLEPLVT